MGNNNTIRRNVVKSSVGPVSVEDDTTIRAPLPSDLPFNGHYHLIAVHRWRPKQERKVYVFR